ncbi:MAG: hypothetical protein ACIAQZ_11840 [Sedimentisphaeraceae bacterium JB056]
MRLLKLNIIILLLAGVCCVANAEVFAPTDATTPGSNNWRPPSQMIDGSGLIADPAGEPVQDRTCNTDGNAMWENEFVVTNAVFILGGSYDLTGTYIWNYNLLWGSDPQYTNRGVKDFEIWVSADSDSATAVWTQIGTTYTINQASASADEAAQYVSFAASGVKLVKFAIKTNHGGSVSGLSEVRFEGALLGYGDHSPKGDLISLSPELSWEYSGVADSYDVYLSADANDVNTTVLNPVALVADDITEPSVPGDTMDELLECTEYYWRVVANNGGSTDVSDLWTFTTGSQKMIRTVSGILYDSSSTAWNGVPGLYDSNITGTLWSSVNGFTNGSSYEWIEYQFPYDYQYAITSYQMSPGWGAAGRAPSEWILYGSNDGTNYDELDHHIGQTWSSVDELKSFCIPVENVASYNIYTLDILAIQDDGAQAQIGDFKLMDKELTVANPQVFDYDNGGVVNSDDLSDYAMTWLASGFDGAVNVLDDFESYADQAALDSDWSDYAYAGTNQSGNDLVLLTNDGKDGTQGLRFNYDITSSGSTTYYKTQYEFDAPVDIANSIYDFMTFDIRNQAGNSDEMWFYVKFYVGDMNTESAYGRILDHETSDQPGVWVTRLINLNKDLNDGSRNDLTNVVGFELSIVSNGGDEGDQGIGTIDIDNISLVECTLTGNQARSDYNGDCQVDFNDYIEFAEEYLDDPDIAMMTCISCE